MVFLICYLMSYSLGHRVGRDPPRYLGFYSVIQVPLPPAAASLCHVLGKMEQLNSLPCGANPNRCDSEGSPSLQMEMHWSYLDWGWVRALSLLSPPWQGTAAAIPALRSLGVHMFAWNPSCAGHLQRGITRGTYEP
jgi:hypothetical protein